MPPTLASGRAVMALFMLAGLLMLFFGGSDLFGAVAVSGTASMYLAPVIFFCLWGGAKHIPRWSYRLSFALALSGAALYFAETAGYADIVAPLFGAETMHKYFKLLLICIVVLVGGCGAFAIGKLQGDKKAAG